MGVRHMFSSHSRDSGVHPAQPNPDPKNFSIQRIYQEADYISALVHYPDATAYEGNKIIVTKGLSQNEFMKLEELDPHFIYLGKVIARFKPNSEGWKDAKEFVARKAAS